ncbi:MAG: Ribose 1,5-bisphosphate phosphokinase PhnN [Promethearchaeota archaeon]|nr:MAG: Ribose 1,5-bisphosphate phosphokinase PhnN [Candidatus Lokiarchaeota archaeon]
MNKLRKNYPGTLFLIVGNSGSGKDSIIGGVIAKYPSGLKKIYVPRRYITREPSELEENIYVSPKEFSKLKNEGKFALSWNIYGLDYGIPIIIDDYLKKGHPVLVNVSRSITERAREKYQRCKVIFIKVPLKATIKRIRERGREEGTQLQERIKRAETHQDLATADFIVNNSGKLEEAIVECLQYILKTIKSNLE